MSGKKALGIDQRLRDRRAWKLVKEDGMTHEDAAAIIGVSKSTVARIITNLAKKDRVKNPDIVAAWREEVLEREAQIQAEAWKAWYASIGEVVVKTVGTQNGEKVNITQTSYSNGDTSYLTVIQKSHDRICKVLGLNAPSRHAVASIDMSNWPEHMLRRVADGEEPHDVIASLYR